MPEKIKITKKEIEELYDITDDDPEKASFKVDDISVNATFEEFTEIFDKEHEKEFRKEIET